MIPRVSIIGLGFWGKIMLDKFRAINDVVVVAVYDRNPKRLDEIKLGDMHFYSNLEQMFECEKMEATVICEIPSNHLHATQLAARHGVHVFCEKPMATSLKDCDTMINVCAESKIKLMIGYKHRFAKSTQYIKQNLPKLGKPLWAMHTYPLWRIDDPGWKFDEKGVNGVIPENMVHSFDLLRYLFGEFQSVYAEGNHAIFVNANPPDSAVITIRFANGAIGAIGGGCTSDQRISQEYLDMHFENGIVQRSGRLDQPYDLRMLIRSETNSENHFFEGSDGVAEEITHFIDCIRKNKEPIANGIDGKKGIEIAFAVMESIRCNRPIKL